MTEKMFFISSDKRKEKLNVISLDVGNVSIKPSKQLKTHQGNMYWIFVSAPFFKGNKKILNIEHNPITKHSS